jgi:anionic cell wall polymer biosynthesis LytR-Cps2A-Psr (LCP) family protein
MKLKDILIVAAITLLPIGVYAAEYSSTTQKMFNKLDTNRDGYISQSESKADEDLSMNWSSADTNKDGKLEESEFSAFEEDRDIGGTPMKQSE